MKKIGKLKLSQLSKDEMAKRELTTLKGGYCSGLCSCAYAGEQCSSGDDYYGGSSNIDNADANIVTA